MKMSLRNSRIFVIEDDVANRAIIQMLLEQNGARTSIERWGTDVIERLNQFLPINLIILDLNFPDEVSGYDIFDQIRAEDAYKDIPIVAVSATDPATAIPICQEKGFIGFISKPVNFDLFPRQIAAVQKGYEIWLPRDIYNIKEIEE
jgi:CheY-like chemotaxis protein